LEDDLNSVYGAVFDHKSETPGLGAEINTPIFQDPFAGKTIFEGEEFISIAVIKGGPTEGDMHAVDGISGGTITSVGVHDMLLERLSMYLPYFAKIKSAFVVDSIFLEIDSLAIVNDSIIN
jgi:Na+-transporting NADH:ubiquinone oxidoreductase subunit C